MTSRLLDLVTSNLRQEYATAVGRDMHKRLQKIFFDANGLSNCDNDLVARIKNIPGLVNIMGPMSMSEVPVAGFVDGKFISRRIDRLYINKDTKTIIVLDYKTDVDKNLLRKKYIEQLKEYYLLLKQIYNGFNIECKILWINDFTLENII